ncbi:hypothetical protein TsocGM_16960 [Tautonia sociabilis]|uniref:Carboxymuconolactone decarboxylase-like domain-containing protein n=2 Tax=Tautonia sociabilis TaxID=2080755 RepID=A0A432MGS9_9BACT|nr:hypothetical protein TsocGM_16960 [Tautonia sociabilis]
MALRANPRACKPSWSRSTGIVSTPSNPARQPCRSIRRRSSGRSSTRATSRRSIETSISGVGSAGRPGSRRSSSASIQETTGSAAPRTGTRSARQRRSRSSRSSRARRRIRSSRACHEEASSGRCSSAQSRRTTTSIRVGRAGSTWPRRTEPSRKTTRSAADPAVSSTFAPPWTRRRGLESRIRIEPKRAIPMRSPPARTPASGRISLRLDRIVPGRRCVMARIRWISENEARGELAEAYASWKARNPGRSEIPGILKCFSLRPDFFRDVVGFSDRLHFSEGHLTRRQKEMIATFVSALNQCPY